MAKVTKPSKFNAVSILIYFCLAALVYAGFMFLPPYYRKWQVKEIIDDAAHYYYSKRFLKGSAEAGMVNKLRIDTVNKIRNMGVKDAGLRLRFERSGDNLTIRAEYKARIKHLLVKKTTTLSFRPYVRMSLRSPDS